MANLELFKNRFTFSYYKYLRTYYHYVPHLRLPRHHSLSLATKQLPSQISIHWISNSLIDSAYKMGQFFDEIPESVIPWIKKQQVFWVATAPLTPDGHVNVSPKGLQGITSCDKLLNLDQRPIKAPFTLSTPDESGMRILAEVVCLLTMIVILFQRLLIDTLDDHKVSKRSLTYAKTAELRFFSPRSKELLGLPGSSVMGNALVLPVQLQYFNNAYPYLISEPRSNSEHPNTTNSSHLRPASLARAPSS